ncbi:uncharacterized protein STEHIDRAFT_117881 [Stereum hirsutum FP-91666 SS1]|uniref:uncharacterized protein n=1 Tax=Stereum hirsutum (strain FP-91666) TaxID=721885 RepID=UPI000440C3F6|nr:uncharacterized protein STEHIDRAFT_117881 [Stereum hirsutum FP-91666 SS1]EIM92957.1 hypothetical protein STEHIDRAFT_117881 [Stereum hirsutum FP-91666 SS1]
MKSDEREAHPFFPATRFQPNSRGTKETVPRSFSLRSPDFNPTRKNFRRHLRKLRGCGDRWYAAQLVRTGSC